MKAKLFIITIIMNVSLSGQIGINTPTPQATLDVVGQPTDQNKFDGIIPPRISGDQLSLKTYTQSQKGALVCVTTAASSPSVQTQEVTKSDQYYYFNGTIWKWISNDSQAGTIPRQILSVNIAYNVSLNNIVVPFPTEFIDSYNAWDGTVYTIPIKSVYEVQMQMANQHDWIACCPWFIIAGLQYSTNGGSSWNFLMKDTNSNLQSGDADNGNTLYWTGELSLLALN